MRISKKILAIALSILMAVSMMPFTVFATTTTVNSISELESALASASSGDTIQLGSDIDYSTTYTVRNARDNGGEHVVDLKDCTLDLNGHTISTINGTVEFAGNGATIENGTFDLVHKSTSGSYQAGSYALIIDNDGSYGATGTVTVNNVICNGAVNVCCATVELNNVTAETTPTKFYAVWAETDANVTINSGTYTDSQTGGKGVLATGKGTEGGATIEIKGGTFDATTKLVASAEANSIKISGGTFSKEVSSEYLADGAEWDTTTGTVTQYVAEAGGVKYTSLKDAIAAISDADTSKGYKANGTVTLLADSIGSGLVIAEGSNLTINFNGKTYDVTNPTVGSPGTETNAFQLLKNSNITFKDGTITSSVAKIMLQNYSNLTLDNMTLTLNNPSYSSAYTLSNNNGNIVIDNTTINANPAGGFAFDVCRYASYPSVNVTVTGDSVINGDVEVYASSSEAKDGFSLTLESGTMNGDIVIDSTAAAVMATEETPTKAVVTKAATFTKDAPEGYEWNESGVLVEDTHSVAEVNGVKYDSFVEALEAISTVTTASNGVKYYKANGTVKLLQDVDNGGIAIASGSNLVWDFNDHTYNVTNNAVGSTGTETIGLQLLKESTVVLKNGTLTSEWNQIQRIIQNYADLTLDNMTISLKGYYYNETTVSTCNGTLTVKDSKIEDPDFSWLGYDDAQAAKPKAEGGLGAVALAAGTFQGYTSSATVVTGDSEIAGNVKVGVTNPETATSNTVTFESGTVGDILMGDNAATEAVVTNTGASVGEIPTGYEWNATTGVLGPIADAFNLSIDDMIHMNLYVNADAYGADEITVTYSDPDLQAGGTKTETFDVADLDQDAQGRYAVKILAAPAQIKDEVTVTAGSHTYTTSVAEYCNALIDANKGEAYTNLAKAMLDYGKAASASFDYNTAAFNYDYSTLNLGQNSVILDASEAIGYFSGFAYIAKSVPALRIYLDTTEAEVVQNNLKAYVNGEEAEITVVEGTDKVCVDITGIKAEDLDKQFSINFNGGTLTLNALQYAKAKGGDTDFGRSMTVYSFTAYAYFA